MKIRPIPYGYIIQNGQHIVQTEQADAVRVIFRLYRNGYSYLAISTALNESGFPRYSADGWNKHQIKRMLENKRYMGDGQYPAIISDEEYNAVRTVRDHKTVSAVSTDKSADRIPPVHLAAAGRQLQDRMAVHQPVGIQRGLP